MLPMENEGSHLFVTLLAFVVICFHGHNYFNQKKDEISKFFKYVFHWRYFHMFINYALFFWELSVRIHSLFNWVVHFLDSPPQFLCILNINLYQLYSWQRFFSHSGYFLLIWQNVFLSWTKKKFQVSNILFLICCS